MLEYSKEWLLGRIQRHSDGFAYPTGLQIELTSFCNATCFFCAHTWSDRPQRHLDSGLFKKMIDEVRSWPVPLKVLYLTGLGEPLMHPEWRSLYEYAEGLPGAFTTNCSVLKSDDIEFLLDLDFYEIAFSLDTLHPQRHQAIRGFSVDRVAPKIQEVYRLARNRKENPRLIVSTTLTYETLHDMKEIFDWLVPQIEGVPNALWYIKQIGHFPDVKAPLKIMPPMDFVKNLNNILPPHPQVTIIQNETSLRPSCTLWFDRTTVLSDGSFVPCCHQAHDHHRIGNIKERTILEIFNSEIWKESQKRFALRDSPGGWEEIPYCKDCR